MPISQPTGAPRQSSNRPSRPDTEIACQLRYLVRSVEPAIVFSSLAHLCVPIFSEECTVDIVEGDDVAYRISYPRSDSGDATATTQDFSGHRRIRPDCGYAVRTRFASAGYTGMMTHLWRTRVPTPADVSRALILVRHGVDAVRTEREEGHKRHGYDTAQQLRSVAAVAGALDPAVAALLEARARRLRHWARCETEHIARQ
jgi:hypothetical protein